MMRNLIVRSTCKNPYFNQALGTYLNHQLGHQSSDCSVVDRPKDKRHVLFLCSNEPSLSLGQNQNYWKEFNCRLLQTNPLPVTRRDTGGGATYVDQGTVLFSLQSQHQQDRSVGFAWLLDALHSLSFKQTVQSGRNDLLIDQKKISGSAFTIHNQVLKHHGSLLLNTELDRMKSYLTPAPEKLALKGIDSVRSRVMNLNELQPDLTVDRVQDQLIASFQQLYGPSYPMVVCNDVHDLQSHLAGFQLPIFFQWYYKFQDTYYIYTGNRNTSRQRYKKAQQVSVRHYFSFGLTEFTFYDSSDTVRQLECDVHSDSLDLAWIALVQQAFQDTAADIRYSIQALRLLCDLHYPEYLDHCAELKRVLDHQSVNRLFK